MVLVMDIFFNSNELEWCESASILRILIFTDIVLIFLLNIVLFRMLKSWFLPLGIFRKVKRLREQKE